MTKELTQLRDLFYVGLREKTGWGRNQIIDLFERCLTDVVSGNAHTSEIQKTVEAGSSELLDVNIEAALGEVDDMPPWFTAEEWEKEKAAER